MIKNLFLIISIVINILLLVILLTYLFTPYFDYIVLHKSIPRICEYTIKVRPEIENHPLCQLEEFSKNWPR